MASTKKPPGGVGRAWSKWWVDNYERLNEDLYSRRWAN